MDRGGARAERRSELEPLDVAMADRLIDLLPGGSALSSVVRERIVTAAEGNPLFVEEMLGMLVDAGRLRNVDGVWRAEAGLDDVVVPPTIRALLAARVDGLDETARSVAERAAVVGRSFELAAVHAIADDRLRRELREGLATLLGNRLIGEDAAPSQADARYRFRHVLIRDAAYERLSKADRADLHERLADWLEASVGDRAGEHAEVIGFHLEQANAFRQALGMVGATADALADRAATWLEFAGSRAERQYDTDAAVGLFIRARMLAPADHRRQVRLLLHLAYTTGRAGQIDIAERYLVDATQLCDGLADEVLVATARLVVLDFEESSDPLRWLEIVHDETERLEPILDAVGDDDALALLWQQRLFVAFRDGRWPTQKRPPWRSLVTLGAETIRGC